MDALYKWAQKEETVEPDIEMGYETDEYYDEQGRKVTEIDYSQMEYCGPVHPPSLPPPPPKKKELKPIPVGQIRYKKEDMTPKVRDPRCSSSTELACFWPVYVGNFRDDEVVKYFATHGLHVRWYFRRNDAYLHAFQSKARLYDQLVYFVSREDAELAVERCHRDTHKGYTLNVFPGRKPVYFPEDRSVYAEKMKSGHIFSEQFFEKHVRFICKVNVACVVKYSMTHGAMEFEKPYEVAKAQLKERMWDYKPVKGQLQKQRFLEKDVLGEIEAYLTANPTTLQVKTDDKTMNMLLRGVCPFIDQNLAYEVIPLRRGPPKSYQRARFQKKMKNKYGKDGY